MTETEKAETKTQHWAVTVRVDGSEVLTIESNCLSGVDNIADYADTVRECGEHLLAFIGSRPSISEGVEAVKGPTERLDEAIAEFEGYCRSQGGYMPAIATLLRIRADEMADKYPDDTNGGRASFSGNQS